MNAHADSERRAILVLMLLVLCYGTILSLATLSRLYGFKTSGVDLASYTQIFHNFMTRGTFLITLPPPFIEQHAFGQHFTPFFYLLVPLYALFPYPEMFQLLQAWAYALTAIPIFLTVRILGWSPMSALLWVALFMLNPFALNAALWDFHETCISTLTMAWLLWAIAAQRRKAFMAFCVLLLMCKEHFGLSVAGAGLLWAIRTRQWRFGLAVSTVGLVSVYLFIVHVMPAYHPEGVHPMMSGGNDTMDRFGWLKDPLGNLDVVYALIFSTIFYAFFLLVPLLGLPLRAPFWLLPGLADLTVNTLSGTGFLRSVAAYHTAPLIPVILVAASAGLRNYVPKPKRLSHREIMGLLLLSSAAFGWSFAPLPLPGALNVWEIDRLQLDYPQKDRKAIADIMAKLPADKRIAAQCNIDTVFAKRAGIFLYPRVSDTADAIVLRIEFPFHRIRNVFGNPLSMPKPEPLRETYEQIMARPDWGITYWNPPWLVIEREPSQRLDVKPQVDAAWDAFFAHYYAIPPKAPEF